MKSSSLLLIVVAIGCGLLAMLGYQEALSNSRPAEPMGEMLIATAEIRPGTPLNDSNTAFKRVPLSAIPEGAVTKKEEYENRALMATAVPGETIMKAKLGEPGVFGVASDIPPGMRLISVEVDATMSAGGLLQPGNRVDVMVTFQSPNKRVGTEVLTVLEDIEVIAVDNRLEATTDEKGAKGKVISLLVTPEQAMELKRAETMGRLHIMMRRPGDQTRNKHRSFAERLEEWEREKLGGIGDVPAGARAELEKQQDPAEPSGSKGTPALENFLDRNTAPVVPVVPERPKTWKIEIFAGDQKTVEEVELPLETTDAAVPGEADALPAAARPVGGEVTAPARPTAPPVPVGQSASLLGTLLKSFFAGTEEETPEAAEPARVGPGAESDGPGGHGEP
ncbi:MAG: Flp pilus assembly protein CpaB [Planctomycetota bacterium]|nr:MAG: Flp pilus assembly protein CpaB [Planctomycetota bacterium]